MYLVYWGKGIWRGGTPLSSSWILVGFIRVSLGGSIWRGMVPTHDGWYTPFRRVGYYSRPYEVQGETFEAPVRRYKVPWGMYFDYHVETDWGGGGGRWPPSFDFDNIPLYTRYRWKGSRGTGGWHFPEYVAPETRRIPIYSLFRNSMFLLISSKSKFKNSKSEISLRDLI